MAIDPKRVLLVRNTHASVAADCAAISDWYANARGLVDQNPDDYFWLGFDFGALAGTRIASKAHADAEGAQPGITLVIDHATTPITCSAKSAKITTAQVGWPAVEAISQTVRDHKIDALLVLPGVPEYFYYFTNFGHPYFQYPQNLELFLATCVSAGQTRIKQAPGGEQFLDRPTGSQVGLSRLFTDGTTSGSARRSEPRPLTSAHEYCVPTGKCIPSGRVGYIRLDTIQHCTLADVQRIVNGGLQAELEDNFTKLHVLGGTAYIHSGGVLISTATNFLGFDAGVNLAYANNSHAFLSGLGYSEAELWPRKPPFKGSPTAATVELTGPSWSIVGPNDTKVMPFALMTPNLSPKVTDPICVAHLGFLPGGYAFCWTSGAKWASVYCLETGGSLGFGVAFEPDASGLLESDQLLNLLLHGYTGAEAVHRARQDAVHTGPSVRDLASGQTIPFSGHSSNRSWVSPHGDPLYAPYKHHNLRSKLIQVGA